jgi:penicillin-binding protein 1C
MGRRFSLKQIFTVFGGLFLLLLVGAAGLWFSTPPPKEVIRLALGSDRVVLDRSGQVLHSLRTDFEKRRLPWQPLKSFSEPITTAVIEAEDLRFFQHWGVDMRGLVRAIWFIARGRSIQGASTITMQVADLTRPEVLAGTEGIKKGTVIGKVFQIVRALGLELRWSKEEILEAYLNLIHLRGEMQGVPAFSLSYWQISPGALGLAEAQVIAAMIVSPNQPFDRLKDRSCVLAKKMGSADCIATENLVDGLRSIKPRLPTSFGNAPHLARRLFQEEKESSIIESTIDGSLQALATSILEKNIGQLRSANVNDGAAIVIDNESGEVLAYVGAVGTSPSPHVDGLMAYRQAGSALKPFFYGKAIELRRLTSASVMLDEPTALSWGDQVYRPTNYDKQFYGPVSVREALASSLNVPAVKAVAVAGLHQSYQLLKDLQFTELKPPDFYGVSMALGAVEVRLDELANAYRMLSMGGKMSGLKITHLEGQNGIDVFSPGTAFIISSILSDPNARSIGFGWESPLETSFWTAVKTGTSKDYRDNWCVGFSEKYTVGVWAGNFDASPMNEVSGVSGAGPTWFEIMNQLHKNVPSRRPSPPKDLVVKKIRHSWSSNSGEEFFLKGTEPPQELVEAAPEKRIEFVFPAKKSVLVRDPHLSPEKIALFIRFKGAVPEGAELYWNQKKLGPAVSPFKVERFEAGKHEVSIRTKEGKSLSSVSFEVRGAGQVKTGP